VALIQDFINSVIATHSKGNATEHSYRPALQKLFDSLEANVTALNEPKKEKVGAPDFSISRGEIVVGHCEAKDLHIDLKAMKDANAAQKKRYVGGLQNLLYTNCLEWIWYRDGELKHEVRIADFLMGVQPIPDRFAALEALLRDFTAQSPQTITSSRALAERMAGKAVLIKDVLANSLMQDEHEESELMDQYKAFKVHLIHDISIKDFADIYAETITYGMFAARLHDTTLNTFSRQEALELLPKSNPFLRNLFGYIAGPNLDPRISWIIDDLALVFRASDVSKLMEKYGHTTQRNDPFLHFYEDFLKAYNPEKRDARGVWYTPEPVVNFIVRAVDDVLKNEFNLPEGLADISKVTIDWDTGQRGITKKGKLTKSEDTVREKRDVHRVQILDPATGTGTFLAEVVKQIAPRVQHRAAGMWASYVEDHLIPRLHGFELLMASYAMCHMKLDMVLREFGYQPTGRPPRVSVFLTNSLEEGEPPNQTFDFAGWFSNEIKAANAVKRDMPIMVVIGNPPYNNSSTNRSDWILGLISDYKRDLNERKINLDDDYIKFIRLAQDYVQRNGAGVVAFITNNSFLDGVTHRKMREILLRTFNEITVLNLHGDTRARTNHANDANVFEITQGVAITLMVRSSSSQELGKLRYGEVLGTRQQKYDALWAMTRDDPTFDEIRPDAPHYFFVPRTFGKAVEGFRINELFGTLSSGIQTKNDAVAIHWNGQDRDAVIRDFLRMDLSALRHRYPDKAVWKTQLAKADFEAGEFEPRDIIYRVFDTRKTVLTRRSGGFLGRPRYDVMRHMRPGNIGLVVNKKFVGDAFSHAFVSKEIICHGTLYLGNRGQDFLCPLYIYPGDDELDQTRRVNFDPKLYATLRALATHSTRGEPDEVAVLDYIYGVLHCPAYRETYAEFLKIDFPRIPWPASADVFWEVSDKGSQLRHLHLIEPAAIGTTPYSFVGDGDGKVEKPEFRNGHVWINKEQRFENAPDVSWGFYIGGYQPAQKWLKDRKGRALDYNDVQHYQRILKILAETDRIMKTIEMPLG
jgi:type I restriction-modification system DNA methylase subunit